jgi:hypothetical protein
MSIWVLWRVPGAKNVICLQHCAPKCLPQARKRYDLHGLSAGISFAKNALRRQNANKSII